MCHHDRPRTPPPPPATTTRARYHRPRTPPPPPATTARARHPPPARDTTARYPEDGICVLAVHCDLDMQTAPSFAQLLTQELDNGGRALIVDLSGCEFLGSSGLSALVTGKDRAENSATSLVLSGLSRVAARAIEATGLNSVFTTYPSTDDAISTLSHRES